MCFRPRRMSHLLEFVNNRLYFAGTQQQHLGRQATQYLLSKLFTSKEFFSQ